jgi:phage host-nuclease inhibitor protein Gam
MERTNDNDVLRQYHEACEEIKKLEALKEGLKAHMLKLVSKGKIETVDYVATLSQYTEKRVASNKKDVSAVDALVAKFGKKAMRPFIKTNKVKKVTVARRADAPVVVIHGRKKLEFV